MIFKVLSSAQDEATGKVHVIATGNGQGVGKLIFTYEETPFKTPDGNQDHDAPELPQTGDVIRVALGW